MSSSSRPKELTLAIGGIAISMRGHGSAICDWPDPLLYQDFRSRRAPEVELEVHCGELPDLEEDEVVFDGEDNHWRLYRSGGRLVLETFEVRTGERRHVGVLRPDFGSGEIYVTPEVDGDNCWSMRKLMRPLGELLVVNRLATGRGVMLHASGVVDRGKGLVFVGPSESGKTTMASLWERSRRATVLSDERVIIRKHGDGFRAYGTPWPGSLLSLSADPVPLNNVFLISHAKENSVRCDEPAALVGDLLSQAFLPFWDQEALARVLATCEELVTAVDARRLGFVNDDSIITFIRGLDES